MAKFKLKADLVPRLVERNIVSPTTGKITMRVHYKENRITGVKCVEFEFFPADVLEVNNSFGIEVFRGKRSPRMKLGTEWFVTDPTIPWFDQVDDATPSTMVIEQDGTQILTRRHRLLVHEYAKDEGLAVPSPVEETPSNEVILQLAKQHHHEKQISR
jgi:hypothetical protein